MSSELMVGVVKKTAGDRIRVACDWGNEPLLTANAAGLAYTITAYTVSCSGSGAPTVTGAQKDNAYTTSAVVAGGSVGTYDLVFTATFDDPDATVLSRVGVLEVVE